jgi:hypothetical protein
MGSALGESAGIKIKMIRVLDSQLAGKSRRLVPPEANNITAYLHFSSLVLGWLIRGILGF